MMDFYEKIGDYLSDQLSEAEKKAFEQGMVEDSALKEAVENHPLAMNIIDTFIESEVRQSIHESEKGSEAQKIDQIKIQILKTRQQRTRNSNIIILISGIIFSAFILYYYFKENKTVSKDQIFAEVYDQPNWPTNRGSIEDSLTEIISIYLAGNANEIKDELKTLKNPESAYWLSEIYLWEQQADSTLKYLPKVQFNTPKNRRDRLLYQEILAYFLKDDLSKVYELKNSLPPDVDTYFLDRLERL